MVVFLDDILIFSRNWSDHLQHIQEVLEALRSNELFCKPSKCTFAASSVKFLGHQISGDSLSSDGEKLSAVKNWPVPCSVP